MGSERRRYERRELKADVYCYIEGRRMDVSATDISAGGMFIETGELVLPGTEVAVVVKSQLSSGSRPVFLAARVMRRQARAPVGIGVRWESATTPGDGETLRAFLKQIIGVDARGVKERAGEDGGLVQAVYAFPLDAQDLERAPAPAPVAPILGGGEDTIDGLDDEEPTVRDLDEELREELATRPASPGPLTMEIDLAASQAPTDLQAVLTLDGKTHKVRISSLGRGNAFILTKLDAKAGTRLELQFGIPARGSVAPVRARGEVLSRSKDALSRKPGLRVKLLRVDEGRHRGILSRYIRWLHFRGIKG